MGAGQPHEIAGYVRDISKEGLCCGLQCHNVVGINPFPRKIKLKIYFHVLELVAIPKVLGITSERVIVTEV
jgi:hypothetical protein